MTTMTAILATFALLLLVALTSVEGNACVDKLPDCARYTRDDCTKYSSWAKYNCNKRCGYCTPTTTAGPSKLCPSGWSYASADHSCYQIFGMNQKSDRKDWYDARQDCRARGGDLLVVKGKGKNDIISRRLSDKTYYWIGLKNNDKTGKIVFKFVDGMTLTSYSYTNWGTLQPDNYEGKEHCVAILFDAKWSDLGCLEAYGYICQRNALN